MKKIILINILLFYIIISLTILLPPIIIDFYSSYKYQTAKDDRHNLINYKDVKWAKKHFQEFKILDTQYYDYIIWRRKPFNGDTITINSDGYRQNNKFDKNIVKKKVWFFGGSSMWGTGSKDDLTIPSLFEKISKFSSANFGESGYTSSQELNLLIKLVPENKPETVIFFDGVNDIAHKCRSENNFFSSARENIIRDSLNSKSNYSETKKITEPLLRIIKKISSILFYSEVNPFVKKNNLYNCDTNIEKSRKIVKNLIINWILAKKIVEENGGKFIPILQPTAFSTKSNIKNLKVSNNLKKQFNFLYPMIKKELQTENIKYLDFTSVLNDDEYYFIDFCHLSPNGNEKIATELIKQIKSFR